MAHDLSSWLTGPSLWASSGAAGASVNSLLLGNKSRRDQCSHFPSRTRPQPPRFVPLSPSSQRFCQFPAVLLSGDQVGTHGTLFMTQTDSTRIHPAENKHKEEQKDTDSFIDLPERWTDYTQRRTIEVAEFKTLRSLSAICCGLSHHHLWLWKSSVLFSALP